MAKFMFIYRGGNDGSQEKSPEEMQQVMQVWMDWIQGGKEAGWLIDGGDALLPTGRVIHADQNVTDGPFAESKELVGGFSMAEAADYDAAVEHAKGCPIFLAGGAVEVRELMMVGKEAQ